jgi:hypothetical protein
VVDRAGHPTGPGLGAARSGESRALCTTHEEETLDRLRTVCDDGTWAVSTWSPALQRWQTTITESPWQAGTRQMTLRIHQVGVRCRLLMH